MIHFVCNVPLLLLRVLVSGLLMGWVGGLAQPAYEASWRAGLMATSQNPASVVAAPFRYEILLGSADLYAQNTLFETNDLQRFLPNNLLTNLVNQPNNLFLFTGIQTPPFYANQADNWYASNLHRIQGPGIAWRIKSNPDMMERGLARMAFSIRVERNELIQLNDMSRELAQAFVNGFPASPAEQITDDRFELRVQEWDGLALSYGLSLGRGNKLLHLAIGGKLLSIGNFMEFQAYNTTVGLSSGNAVSLQSDSVVFSYNPSFARAVSAQGNPLRRWNNFEYSWGVLGELGLIYQVLDYQRQVRFEIGASVQDVGAVQFWNLNRTSYRLEATEVTRDDIAASTEAGVDGIDMLLDSLGTDTAFLGSGVTERLPLILTGHAKLRIGQKWGLHLRGNFRRVTFESPWETLFRATLSYETKGLSFFLPVSSTLVLPSPSALELRPRLGLFLSLGDRLIVGSNDILTTMFYSSIRQGVAASHLFVGLHFPIKSEI